MGDGPLQERHQVPVPSHARAADRAQCRLPALQPGAGFPLHKHDFAQVWYIIEGEFQMGQRKYGPGTLVYMEDPHFEDEMRTETGGTVLFVQYPGPTTGGRPIYEGRMNVTQAPRPEDLDLEH